MNKFKSRNRNNEQIHTCINVHQHKQTNIVKDIGYLSGNSLVSIYSMPHPNLRLSYRNVLLNMLMTQEKKPAKLGQFFECYLEPCILFPQYKIKQF